MEEIERYMRARVPLIQMVSHEETRALQYLAEVTRRLDKEPEFIVWSMTRGLTWPLNKNRDAQAADPMDVLGFIAEYDKPAVFVLLDYHPYMKEDNPAVVRALRDVVQVCRPKHKSVVLLQPKRAIPDDLAKEMAYVEMPLPDVIQLQSRLTGTVKKLGQTKYTAKLGEDDVERIVQAGQGLTRDEFDSALSLALVENGCLDDRTVQMVAEEKKAVIKKTGILEYIEAGSGLDSIGGLENLKDWAMKRRRAFTNEAREFGLPQPKGAMLVGVQGCGKSLAAKALSAAWQLPLIRLDMGALMGGLVGESEANTRHALSMAEAVSPCIMWIDEIEKSMAGVQSSGSTDGGTTARVFSTILTWMNDKKKPVFVIATANRAMDLPPELMRKGRFDEIFFVDLPHEQEREKILEIHLRRRGRDAAKFDVAKVAKLAKGFSGAELEQVVVAGLYDAFDEERDVSSEDLARAVEVTVPLSVTMGEQVQGLRDWCSGRAVKASRPPTETKIVKVAKDENDSEIGNVFGGGGLIEA